MRTKRIKIMLKILIPYIGIVWLATMIGLMDLESQGWPTWINIIPIVAVIIATIVLILGMLVGIKYGRYSD